MDPKKVFKAASATYKAGPMKAVKAQRKAQVGGNWLDDLGSFVGAAGQAALPFAPLLMGAGRRRVAGMPSR